MTSFPLTRLALLATLFIGLTTAHAQPTAEVPFDSTLAAELEAMHEVDQGGRKMWHALSASYDGPVPDSIRGPFWSALSRLDSLHFARLDSIVAVSGWPGRSTVGEDGVRTAFLVVQHAPLEAQERYLPLLEASVAEGEAEAWQLAMLTDRVLVRRGLPQRYGSQFRVDPETGERTYDPVEDPARLNARREAIGLPPHRHLGGQ